MNSYEFLEDIKRLAAACKRFERRMWLLNAMVTAMALYVVFLLFGLVKVFRFYGEGTLLVYAPAAVCLILGMALATLIRRHRSVDIFMLLGPAVSEMARAAYDNRSQQSVVMERLAEEVRGALSRISPGDILDRRRLYLRLGSVVIIAGLAAFIIMGDIGEIFEPPDFQPISDLVRGVGSDEVDSGVNGRSSINLSGEIYGKPSLAVLEEANLELMLYPGGGTGSLARPAEEMDRLFQTAPPGQGVAVSSELYIESLPPQHREMIKRYFENLAKD
ncbi:MAG: hypothetical protein GKC10_04580 [Methanosarcinales archaeon]|nr:hypothetical protein [Methanosarcinales archaeon]